MKFADELEWLMAEATRAPWQALVREYPHYLDSHPCGKHKEWTIHTAYDDPQLKGPYPIITMCVGLGETKDSPPIHMVGLRERDALLIIHLANNAGAIVRLVRAAQHANAMSIQGDTHKELRAALTALETSTRAAAGMGE